MEPVVIKSFYGWNLAFDPVEYQRHIQKVQLIKKQMGDKYLLATNNLKGKNNG